MFFIRSLAVASLLFASVPSMPAWAQQQENIVLLPIEVSPEYANQKNLIGVALQQSLSKNFNVFYGDSVEAALQAEYAKEDCSAEACVQNIAILFNGEIVVDASLQLVEKSTFLSVQFRNVITGELEAVVQDACEDCSFSDLIKFIDQRTNNIQLKSSAGLTALLKEAPEPKQEVVSRAPVQVRKKEVFVPQQTARRKPQKVASPSYWKWGLGALVVGAAGGGGGGGGCASGMYSSDASGTRCLDESEIERPDPMAYQTSYEGNASFNDATNSNIKFYRGEGDRVLGEFNENFGLEGTYPLEAGQEGFEILKSPNDSSIKEICFPCESGLGNPGTGNVFGIEDVVDEEKVVETDRSFSYSKKNGNLQLAGFSDYGNDTLILAGFDEFDAFVFGLRRYPNKTVSGDAVAYNYNTFVEAFVEGIQRGIPSNSGEQTFSGFSVGQFLNGEISWTSSTVQLVINFNADTFTLTSSDTKEANNLGATFLSRADLDFVANGAIALNQFDTSDVSISSFTSSANKLVKGKAYALDESGQNSREYAGVFQFQEDDKMYIGSFGADE